MFFPGGKLIDKDVPEKTHKYRAYTNQDLADCTFSSKDHMCFKPNVIVNKNIKFRNGKELRTKVQESCFQ